MKRRSFLRSSALSTAPILIGGIPIATLKHRQLFDFINMDNDKVLILIQLKGGNDGLNTLIPIDQYSNLFNARSNIIIPENQILAAEETNGFHPEMTGMKNLFDCGSLSVIQNVGYENQNRSHFRSIDIWKTASAADEVLTTGWLGRFFDDKHPAFPTGYPNEDFTDPIAITIGSLISDTCQGIGYNFSSAVNNPGNLSNLPGSDDFSYPDTKYGNELKFIAQSIQQTNAYQEVLAMASAKGSNLSTLYNEDDESRLKEQLKIIARLISGGLKTKIYIASIGGFDTHANQAESEDTTIGKHAQLLKELSDAIAAFQDDVQLLGIDERVVGMTFSEFGRRIKSNGSLGTDHGTAAPMFLFGSCVNPGIVGSNPTISNSVENNEGVAMELDFKSVYGSVLMDWFEVEESAIKTTLFNDFTYMPLLGSCATTSVSDPTENRFEIRINPNPVSNDARISMIIGEPSKVKITLFDSIGSQLRTVADQSIDSGQQHISVDFHDLPAGTYYLRCRFPSYAKSIRFVKL